MVLCGCDRVAVKEYYKNNDSYVSEQSAFRNQFNIPLTSAHDIEVWIKYFNEMEIEEMNWQTMLRDLKRFTLK